MTGSIFMIPINKPVSLQENIPVSQYMQLMMNAFHSGMAQRDNVLSQLMMAFFTLIDNYLNSSLPQIAHYQKLLELLCKSGTSMVNTGAGRSG